MWLPHISSTHPSLLCSLALLSSIPLANFRAICATYSQRAHQRHNADCRNEEEPPQFSLGTPWLRGLSFTGHRSKATSGATRTPPYALFRGPKKPSTRTLQVWSRGKRLSAAGRDNPFRVKGYPPSQGRLRVFRSRTHSWRSKLRLVVYKLQVKSARS